MSYPAAPTYWLEPTDQVVVGLRRYNDWPMSRPGPYDCAHGHHRVLRYIGRDGAHFDERGYLGQWAGAPEHNDERWPQLCEGCDYRFVEQDCWQPWQELVYRRTGTAQEYVLHQGAGAPEYAAPSATPGASWDAWWYHRKGPDGISLAVLLPNGHTWLVDSEASNCTRKGELHECWVRHGNPRECRITVDKAGDTCAAGAGSIASGDYHGFLRDGLLTAG